METGGTVGGVGLGGGAMVGTEADRFMLKLALGTELQAATWSWRLAG